MTEVGPKTPRIEDPRYLGFLRTIPCSACYRPAPSDAAHIRMAGAAYGKRATGFGEKPHDRWAVPLCRECHVRQHSMSEGQFWRDLGKNPFEIATRLYALGGHPEAKAPKKRGAKIKSAGKIPSRPFPKTSRKFGR